MQIEISKQQNNCTKKKPCHVKRLTPGLNTRRKYRKYSDYGQDGKENMKMTDDE
jgi:hypothetical protein